MWRTIVIIAVLCLLEFVASSAKLVAPSEGVKLVSSDYTDEQIAGLRLTRILIEIRECQLLQKESVQSTFIGSMAEFQHAHEIMAEVLKVDPVAKQKRLLVELRRINRHHDNELFERCFRFADEASGWKQ